MAAPLAGGHFWPRRTTPSGLGCGETVTMTDETAQDRADRVGKRIATIVIVLLIALFAYGYLGPFVSR